MDDREVEIIMEEVIESKESVMHSSNDHMRKRVEGLVHC